MKNIESLKERLGIKTSEQMFDISEQPPQQCSNVDGIILDLENTSMDIQGIVRDIKRTDNIELIQSLADYIEHYSSDIDKSSELNELRKQIELIRSWGEEWKHLAKSLLNNIKNEEDLVHYFSNDSQVKYDELSNMASES